MITIKGLNYHPSDSEINLWEDLNFTLNFGTIYALVGVNGVGKTTLLNILSGLLLPTKGDVYWREQRIHQNKKNLRNYIQQVGYCFQDAEHLFFRQTVKDELEYHHQGDIEKIVSKFGLEPILSLSPFELSCGQQKLLELAIMLLKQPTIIFCDEITAGLDTKSRELVWEILNDYKKEKSIVFVTHDLTEAMEFCDEFLFLASDGLHKFSVSDILKKPAVFERFGLLPPDNIEICRVLIDQDFFSHGDYMRSNQEIAKRMAKIIKKRAANEMV